MYSYFESIPIQAALRHCESRKQTEVELSLGTSHTDPYQLPEHYRACPTHIRDDQKAKYLAPQLLPFFQLRYALLQVP